MTAVAMNVSAEPGDGLKLSGEGGLLHFPTEQAALNAFEITFDGRLSATRNAP